MKENLSESFEIELGQLFDLRREKIRRDERREEELRGAKKEIQLLLKMFSEDIPTVSVPLGSDTYLEWDARIKRLLYHHNGVSRFVESVQDGTLIEIRKHLLCLVKSAKKHYLDQ